MRSNPEADMKSCRQICSALAGALCAVGAACAMAQDPAPAAPLRVYDATELTPDRYTVIQRVWTGSWRSALGYPEHADSGAAIGALSAEAGRLGADGLTNLSCLEDPRAGLGGGPLRCGRASQAR